MNVGPTEEVVVWDESQLQETRARIELIHCTITELRREVLPENKAMYTILSTSYLKMLRKLEKAVRVYYKSCGGDYDK